MISDFVPQILMGIKRVLNEITGLINDSTPEEKLHLHDRRVLVLLCDLIAECGSFQKQTVVQQPQENDRRRRRRNSGGQSAIGQKGVGYGHGSTRSRWDIERAVEERLAREEHLIWVLNALTAFIFCANPDFHDTDFIQLSDSAFSHMTPPVVKVVTESAIVALLEYHLNNDSVFDVSEHMELYQALLETAAAMSCVPELVPYLVKPPRPDSKSVAKELVPRFRDIMDSYPNSFKGHMGSPDFRLVDFIRRIDRYSESVKV
ncbi:hypothetical protein QR680_018821 [Steinernema hermaphroditum]|uniref:Uncharacterized protein n=1 Tax=Steinernema hermaphroditum TaxID=289476 RepID=A0AA39HJ36_9BILA|nr:hypothetical protein QR680_018821 [Steinernema hermaphroditum]